MLMIYKTLSGISPEWGSFMLGPNLQKPCTPHQQTKASVMSGCLDIL